MNHSYPENKLLFLADFHVKARTWTNNTQVRGDAYQAMQVIGDYAESNGISTLLIGGDFFDSNRPTPDDLVQTVDFLTRFKQVYYIRGNHDSCDPSYLEAVSRILGPKQFVTQLIGHIVHLPGVHEGKGVCLTGIPWMPNKEEYRKAVFDTIRYFNENYTSSNRLYLMLHTSFKELLSFDGAYTFDREDFRDLCPNNNINLLVGDVHVRDTAQTMFAQGTVGVGSMMFHSPGSVYPLQFNDSDQFHGATVIDMGQKGKDQFQRLPVSVRQYTSHRYSGMQELEDFLKDLQVTPKEPTQVLPTYVRVLVPPDKEMPHISTADWPDFVIQLQLETAAQEDAQVRPAQDGYTLEQAIAEEFEDPDVAEIANKLVSSPDPAEELRECMDFWQVERITL